MTNGRHPFHRKVLVASMYSSPANNVLMKQKLHTTPDWVFGFVSTNFEEIKWKIKHLHLKGITETINQRNEYRSFNSAQATREGVINMVPTGKTKKNKVAKTTSKEKNICL